MCILPCENGEEPNEDCDECDLVNICERDSPCDNGGTCSLNGAPDQYTCDCINLYIEHNCSGTRVIPIIL